MTHTAHMFTANKHKRESRIRIKFHLPNTSDTKQLSCRIKLQSELSASCEVKGTRGLRFAVKLQHINLCQKATRFMQNNFDTLWSKVETSK